MLTFEEYKEEVKKLKIGKRVGKNLYILWPDLKKESSVLTSVIKHHGEKSDTTLIKFFVDQFKVSYLQYPDFFTDPHPSLKESHTLDLTSGRSRVIDYSKSKNPPILHRKETMISPKREEFSMWESLTKELEEYGCYKEPRKIGFKSFWDELLISKGLKYEGHSLIKTTKIKQIQHKNEKVIDRHKTAISRGDFSKPLQLLMKHNLIDSSKTYFDYGCGLGDDIRALKLNGYDAIGWDPVHAPEQKKRKSEVVNLGFVLNVIEDPVERIEVLENVFNYTKKVLSIAVVTDNAPTAKNLRPYKDGFLTSRDTFQKYFKHEEIQDLIEETLNISAHPVAPGIFFIFKDEKDAQDFLSAKQNRRVDWNKLNLHIYPSKHERDAAKKELLYEKYREDLEKYWEYLLNLGRIPTDNDYPEGKALKEKTNLSDKKLQSWFIERYGQKALEDAFNARRDDLLVYLGLANFKRKVPFSALSNRLQKDMKSFFGSYQSAQIEALQELYKIGNPELIEEKCNTLNREKNIGTLDHQALFIKTEELQNLDPILRMYVGVAGLLYGDINDTDQIKIHKLSGKVTFIIKNNPELKAGEYLRVKVNLRNQKADYYWHKD